jgi:hypothetical protein
LIFLAQFKSYFHRLLRIEIEKQEIIGWVKSLNPKINSRNRLEMRQKFNIICISTKIVNYFSPEKWVYLKAFSTQTIGSHEMTQNK